MSHQDDILAIMKTLERNWYDTKEIHTAIGDYWRLQRISIADSKTQQYTVHSLQRLYIRGLVEKRKEDGRRCTLWRVVE